MALDDRVAKAAWLELCNQAWTEEDPVRLLDVTMQITKFLAKKQQRLDAEYDAAYDEASEEQKIKEADEAVRKSGLN
jgi:hypothetical protein